MYDDFEQTTGSQSARGLPPLRCATSAPSSSLLNPSELASAASMLGEAHTRIGAVGRTALRNSLAPYRGQERSGRAPNFSHPDRRSETTPTCGRATMEYVKPARARLHCNTLSL
jgi:hypothetical protein